jgi:hypothetical protein
MEREASVKSHLVALLLGLGALTAGCQNPTVQADEQKVASALRTGIADVRSAATSFLSAARANAGTAETVLQAAQTYFPPGSDLSNLDAEGQALVQTLQTSTNQQLLALAAQQLVTKYAPGVASSKAATAKSSK